MKKFYETPAVEITGFEVEDIITTSGVDPESVADSLSSDFADQVRTAMELANSMQNTGAAKYGTYKW